MPPPAAYTSPIPITTTGLGHALASEWTKIRTVRSTLWTLGVMFLFVIGLGMLMTFTVGEDEYDSSPILSFGLPGVLLGQLGVVTLGVLVITSEYSTGMIRTTLTACPRRGRVLAAKAIVFFVVTLVLSTAACSLVALINYAQLGGRDITGYAYTDTGHGDVVTGQTSVTSGEVVRATFGIGLYMALLGLLALAVGVLLRHTAGAITTMLGVVLLPLLAGLFIPDDDVRETLQEYSAPNIIGELYDIPIVGEDNGWGLLGLLALVTTVTLAAAATVLHSRDV
ncbi:ABC transporter permease [Wenjunlia vitaminophila]|uniref:ABC transporter permease n=1 Tax=Wenjunlia vitaminophila TaxID=76728 RepID=A0A0T6LTZ6_WENVI|nr:ABC transporter permease [Wenjunlia vitaminophila]